MQELTQVAVVGAGPCGVAAAIQLQRTGLPPLLFEGRSVGGLLLNAHLVENYPGFSRGISGPGFCRLLKRHLYARGVTPVYEEIVEAKPEDRGYVLKTEKGRLFPTKALIVATGTRPVTGVLRGGGKLAGRRLFYEVHEAISRASGERAAILGGSDAAYDYALNLASRGFRIHILQRSQARCLSLLAERAAQRPDISVREGVVVSAFRETGEALEIRLNPGGERLEVDFLVIACGRVPSDKLLQSLKGSSPPLRGGRASHEGLPAGVFAGGDLVRGHFRQAGIAVGDGLAAAMAVTNYLKSLERKDHPT